MKHLQMPPKLKEILCSVLVASCLGFALLQLAILPTQQEVKTVKQQNQALRVQIKTLKKGLQNQGKGFSSNAFYEWFSAQNFSSLKLLNLKGNAEGLQLSLAGSINALLPFLEAVQNSRFTTLTFSDMQSNTGFLDLEIASFAVASPAESELAPIVSKTQKRNPAKLSKQVSTKTKILGTARSHGIKYCVLEVNGALRLRKEGKC